MTLLAFASRMGGSEHPGPVGLAAANHWRNTWLAIGEAPHCLCKSTCQRNRNFKETCSVDVNEKVHMNGSYMTLKHNLI